MRFEPALLEEFRALLQTTGLQRAHGEFVRMFRWLVRLPAQADLADGDAAAAAVKDAAERLRALCD